MKIRAGSIRFDYLNRSFLFDAGELEAPVGSLVIVEMEHGVDRGTLEDEISEVELDKGEKCQGRMLRVAGEEDLRQLEGMAPREERAFIICEEEIEGSGLKMKLISARSSFDGAKMSFCYTSEGRVDFRDLVRRLASRLKMRIELRQVGVRDEARLLGGLGVCGRPLCCATFLKEFQPVSIRMAKEQGLPLNPIKISGICGRLFCCLKYEFDQYCEMRKGMPRPGEEVVVGGEKGRVAGVNVIKGTATVELGEGRRREATMAELGRECAGCGAADKQERVR
ncbi:MAG: regulatory iron-sulfur-containing complex subunit RicT [bacterium]